MMGRTSSCTAAVTVALVLGTAGWSFALDVQSVAVIHGHGRTNGTGDYYFFEVMVEGTGIVNARVVDTTTNASLTNWGGNRWGYEDPVEYANFTTFSAAHANPGMVSIYFNEGESDSDMDMLGFSVAGPTGFATITNPTHNATGVATDPTYQWTSVAALSNAVGISKFVEDHTGTSWYEELFDNDLTQTSWQPGPLTGMTDYCVGVAVVNLVGGAGMPIRATTDTQGKSYDYYGVFAQDNEIDFTTAPEPGTIALLGTALMFVVGLRRRRRM